MEFPPLLICERTGTWAVALKRVVRSTAQQSTPRIIETRSLVECRKGFEGPSSADFAVAPLVVESTTGDLADLLDLLTVHVRRRPRVPRFVVGPLPSDDFELLLREAGAVDWIASPRGVGRIVQTLRRYDPRGAAITVSLLEPPISLTDRLRASLPWRPVE
ncbi:MAG: hypothetical protein JNL96_10145 [Planctomycetaceae bacterium]|nr:hypothetical protein [Planctomycetaceae bacterium]